MDTIDDIFQAFGGTGAFASAMGLNLSTASEMRRRPSIPVRHWPLLIEAAKAKKIKGVTLEALVQIHAAKGNS